jgi:hypothetical protein
MFWKKKTDEKVIDVITENNWIENQSSNMGKTDETKKNNSQKEEKKQKSTLWEKNTINFYDGFLEQLLNMSIISNTDLKNLLEWKSDTFKYKTIVSFLDDVSLKLGKNKEVEILDFFFNKKLWYEIIVNNEDITPSSVLLDLFNVEWINSLTKEDIDKIINSNILPFEIKTQKNNILYCVSRTPEIPSNFHECFKSIIQLKSIAEFKVLLVSKDIYNEIKYQLTEREYSIEL